MLLALVFVLSVSASSTAAPPFVPRETVLRDFPCSQCVTAIPQPNPAADAFGVPVLVLLHGDGQAASTLFDPWKGAATRGIAVVSLACPSDAGCKGSWWRWNGDPAWIDAQLEKVNARVKIDRARLWIAGFSGGASYIGYRTQQIEQTFSALVIHGGGMAPADTACSTATRRTYFLLGDKNPLHALAQQLRAHCTQCGGDVTQKLLIGGDHPADWRALDKERPAIVDWLIARSPMRVSP